MTYREIAKAIREHRGRVYACVNASGCQYHIEAKKGEAFNLFHNYAVHYGENADSELSIQIRSGELFIDTEPDKF